MYYVKSKNIPNQWVAIGKEGYPYRTDRFSEARNFTTVTEAEKIGKLCQLNKGQIWGDFEVVTVEVTAYPVDDVTLKQLRRDEVRKKVEQYLTPEEIEIFKEEARL